MPRISRGWALAPVLVHQQAKNCVYLRSFCTIAASALPCTRAKIRAITRNFKLVGTLVAMAVILTACVGWALPSPPHVVNENDAHAWMEDWSDFEPPPITVYISATQADTLPGEYVDIDINLDINAGITILHLRITYDTAILERVAITPGEIMQFPTLPTVAGRYNLMFELEEIFSIATCTGSLATLHFRVLDNAPAGATPIVLEVASAYIAEGFSFEEIGVHVENGAVNVARRVN